jgi:hypothetical protein
MAMSKFSKSFAALPPYVHKNLIPFPSPSIPFVSKMKKVDKVNGPDAEESEWIKLGFLMDPDNPASKYPRPFAIFKEGFPEEWIKWVMAFREIENLILLKEPAGKTRISWTLLKGPNLILF